mmetsp:Transcript_49252/g.157730  ORF Transcript_49252/g.157730 Transcript_49252/m.157730 type:complete len:138 (-) Transcript_49252:49-462(-)
MATMTQMNLITRKEKLEEELRNVEKQVYDLETSYLHDHSTNGNIIKGFEGFLSANKATSLKKARTFKAEDRLFSLSSLTSPAVEENLLGQMEGGLLGSRSSGNLLGGGPMLNSKRSRLSRETKRFRLGDDDDDDDFM